ncbi:MAG: hypothetical protein HY814_01520 [Candidatus Riflebacteria bacterium]|nr:hypothetical protein [Candidatus Riflebacteria bacterium]
MKRSLEVETLLVEAVDLHRSQPQSVADEHHGLREGLVLDHHELEHDDPGGFDDRGCCQAVLGVPVLEVRVLDVVGYELGAADEEGIVLVQPVKFLGVEVAAVQNVHLVGPLTHDPRNPLMKHLE